jgi:hypothetical protein
MCVLRFIQPDMENEINLEAFLRYDVPALQQYLLQLGLAVSGNKATLAARAFAACEVNLPVVPNSKEKEAVLEKQYETLLCLEDGTRLQDPFTIPDVQWIEERQGMKLWPPTMI